EDKADLKGLPEGIIEAAAQTASEKKKDGKWVFTLAYPSYIPFMTYCDNRSLREKMFMAYNTKASKGDNLDNREVIQNILRLRDERAKLLGKNQYENFFLKKAMAENQAKGIKFCNKWQEK